MVMLEVWAPVAAVSRLCIPTCRLATELWVRLVKPEPREKAEAVVAWIPPPTTISTDCVVAAVAPEVIVVEEALELVLFLSKVGVPVKPLKYWTTILQLAATSLKATLTVNPVPPVVGTQYQASRPIELPARTALKLGTWTQVLPLLSVTPLICPATSVSEPANTTKSCPTPILAVKAAVVAGVAEASLTWPSTNAIAITPSPLSRRYRVALL